MQSGFDFSGEVAAAVGQTQGFEMREPVFGMIDGWAGRTCAQYISVEPYQLSRKPDSLSHEEAAVLPLVSLTALQALRDEVAIKAGCRVCINGAAGGVGGMAVQIAKMYNASVTAIAGKSNHAFLKDLGADRCVDYHRTDITRSRECFDIFFEVFSDRLFESAQSILAPRGVWVSTVLRPEGMAAVERTKNSEVKRAKLIRVRSDPRDLAEIGRWVESGLIRPVIHDIFPMEKIGDAHKQQETKHTRGKLVVTIT